MEKIGIYDPYLHILGGAERYIFSIARCLQSSGQITIFTQNPELFNQAQEKFGIPVAGLQSHIWPKFQLERNRVLKEYSLFFYITDGSIFRSTAKKNILIIQTPLHIPKKSLLNYVRYRSWSKIICYSHFMKELVIKHTGKNIDELFVPVEVPIEDSIKKKRVILSVGRFFTHLHNKKQKEMVLAFSSLLKKGIKDVELYLVGSIDPGAESYVDEVKHLATGLPVRILNSVSYGQLQKLYGKAQIYWHATGWGENLEKYPEKAEHFGVSTLEAMASATVPIVFDGGGQREIVTNGYNGFVFRNEEELKKYTEELLENRGLWEKLSKAAIKTASQYSFAHFCERLHEIIA